MTRWGVSIKVYLALLLDILSRLLAYPSLIVFDGDSSSALLLVNFDRTIEGRS